MSAYGGSSAEAGKGAAPDARRIHLRQNSNQTSEATPITRNMDRQP
jgi:hypothetical protein